ncbi:MAG: SCP2 sterol-binding domain-containing protein [Thermoflexales bacterium]|nr:SCP2 sterol-binding domain-containing protein [Thermoflexales bacterium]
MFKFPSDAWVKALMEDLNQSAAYAEAAKNWEGDFYFVVEPGGTLVETVLLYMDLWHGKCRDAFGVTDELAKTPVFRMSAPVATWKKVLTKKLDPIQGLMTMQLKLKGDMKMVMKNVKAAKELVESCTRIETEFPL